MVRKTPPKAAARRDVIATTDPNLSAAVYREFKRDGALLKDPKRSAADEDSRDDDKERLRIREALLEAPDSDPTGHERIIGESDLTSINYLLRGKRAANAVCRIRVPTEGGEWYGTGFLVGPRLLMTNNHVLSNAAEASQAEAEFAYEHDVDGVLSKPVQFNLCPHDVFFTDIERDVTLVSVALYSDGGVPLERFGWIPLLPLSGKAIDQEWVTIIQHPNGGPKQISIRSSRVVSLSGISQKQQDYFVHYLTDTEPGSSGSPVLNDQWQVFALHHKAVPAPGSPPGEDQQFIGNQGVRVSAIFNVLEDKRMENDHAKRALDKLEQGLGLQPLQEPVEATFEREGKAFTAKRWSTKKQSIGYDPVFLSERIDLGKMYAKRKADVAPLLSGRSNELKYHHFSVVVHAKRKFALLTAVNIHGGEFKKPKGDRSDVWRRDPRMADEYQPDGDFYIKSRGSDKVSFSRGHLVRRFDPCWDTDALSTAAEIDTFHYTNAAPQVQGYNNVDWGNLEDYVLARAITTEKKMSVFTGPIFRRNDPWYGRERKGGPWRIPLSYWKIAVLEKAEDELVAAAFIVGQTEYVQALYEAKLFAGLRPYRLEEMRARKIQVSIKAVMRESKLDFTQLLPYDAHGSLESTRQARWINRPEDIII